MSGHQNINILFDIDGTLINFEDQPRWEVISLLKLLKQLGCNIYVWSGGGKSYAELWVRRLFLTKIVDDCFSKFVAVDHNSTITCATNNALPFEIDVTFDDEEVKLGKVNIRLPSC